MLEHQKAQHAHQVNCVDSGAAPPLGQAPWLGLLAFLNLWGSLKPTKLLHLLALRARACTWGHARSLSQGMGYMCARSKSYKLCRREGTSFSRQVLHTAWHAPVIMRTDKKIDAPWYRSPDVWAVSPAARLLALLRQHPSQRGAFSSSSFSSCQARPALHLVARP